MYLSDDLIRAAKRRGFIPTAQGAYTNADFLAAADEEIRSYILPLIRRTQEDYSLQQQDYTVTQGAQYRIPYRAVMSTLRGVYPLDAQGNIIPCPRVDPDDLADVAWGLYILGNVVFLLNSTGWANPAKLRALYFIRPSSLVLASGAAQVTDFDADTKTITISTPPAGYAGNTSWDIVRGRPGFELLGFDLPGALLGSTLTMGGPLPSDLALGDWVCLPEQTPIPQIPAELHPLLAERVAAAFLRSQGDKEGYAASKAEQSRLEADALVLLSQRIGGEVRKVINRGGLFRRQRRW